MRHVDALRCKGQARPLQKGALLQRGKLRLNMGNEADHDPEHVYESVKPESREPPLSTFWDLAVDSQNPARSQYSFPRRKQR